MPVACFLFALNKYPRFEIPAERMEAIAQMYENQEYDKVEALAGLFVECWDNYAEGHNYLGLTAMTKNDLAVAETHLKMP